MLTPCGTDAHPVPYLLIICFYLPLVVWNRYGRRRRLIPDYLPTVARVLLSAGYRAPTPACHQQPASRRWPINKTAASQPAKPIPDLRETFKVWVWCGSLQQKQSQITLAGGSRVTLGGAWRDD